MKYIVCFVGLQAPVSALFCNNGVTTVGYPTIW